MSSRRLDQYQYFCLGHTSSRLLQDVFKTSSRQGVFKTFSGRFQDVLQKLPQQIFKASWQDFLKRSPKLLLDVFQKLLQDVFETFSRRIIRLNCLPRSRICLGHTSKKFMVSVENYHV